VPNACLNDKTLNMEILNQARCTFRNLFRIIKV